MINHKERLLCAATWYDNGEPYTGNMVTNIATGYVVLGIRHVHNIAEIFRREGDAYDKTKMTHGFITYKGRFLSRVEAQEFIGHKGTLTSEDLY